MGGWVWIGCDHASIDQVSMVRCAKCIWVCVSVYGCLCTLCKPEKRSLSLTHTHTHINTHTHTHTHIHTHTHVCLQETSEMGLDPEFLAALPPEIQAEVLQQQRTERRRAQVGVGVRVCVCEGNDAGVSKV